MRVEDAVHGGEKSGGPRTFRPRLPCRQLAGAESCIFFSHDMSFSGMSFICVVISLHVRLGLPRG